MNTRNFEILAQRTLILFEPATGTRSEIKISIGQPYWREKNVAAACPLSVEGLTGRLPDIEGIDMIQCLQLAISLTEQLLNSVPEGKLVMWPDGEPYK